MAKNFGIVDPSKYNGLTVEEARSLAEEDGLTHRIVEVDGNSFILTMDLKTDRVNFRVRNNIITDTFTG